MTTIKLGSKVIIDTLTENIVKGHIVAITEHLVRVISDSGRVYLLSHKDAKIAAKCYIDSIPVLIDKVIL